MKKIFFLLLLLLIASNIYSQRVYVCDSVVIVNDYSLDGKKMPIIVSIFDGKRGVDSILFQSNGVSNSYTKCSYMDRHNKNVIQVGTSSWDSYEFAIFTFYPFFLDVCYYHTIWDWRDEKCFRHEKYYLKQ